jgi:hypothetical protein
MLEGPEIELTKDGEEVFDVVREDVQMDGVFLRVHPEKSEWQPQARISPRIADKDHPARPSRPGSELSSHFRVSYGKLVGTYAVGDAEDRVDFENRD